MLKATRCCLEICYDSYTYYHTYILIYISTATALQQHIQGLHAQPNWMSIC